MAYKEQPWILFYKYNQHIYIHIKIMLTTIYLYSSSSVHTTIQSALARSFNWQCSEKINVRGTNMSARREIRVYIANMLYMRVCVPKKSFFTVFVCCVYVCWYTLLCRTGLHIQTCVMRNKCSVLWLTTARENFGAKKLTTTTRIRP